MRATIKHATTLCRRVAIAWSHGCYSSCSWTYERDLSWCMVGRDLSWLFASGETLRGAKDGLGFACGDKMERCVSKR